MSASPSTPSTPSGPLAGGAAPGPRERAARILSEVFAPWVCAAVLPVVVGAVTAGTWWVGALLGGLTAVVVAGLPYLLVLRGVRRGSLSDRDVSRRADRPLVLGTTLALVAACLLVGRALGAPPALTDLVAGMVACLVAGLAVSLWWKVSLHTLVLAASVVALVVLLGPVALALGPAVVAVAWARVVLGAHTPAQVVAGAGLGVLTAVAVLALL